jgi:hypothetical protein
MGTLAIALAQAAEPTLTDSANQVSNTIWFATLGFGAFALLLVGIIQFVTSGQTDGEATTFVPFARTYGLIVIATLAAALTLSTIDLDSKTGAFALLGTIAGYLAATAGGKSLGSPPGGNGKGGEGGSGKNMPEGERRTAEVPPREAVI